MICTTLGDQKSELYLIINDNTNEIYAWIYIYIYIYVYT